MKKLLASCSAAFLCMSSAAHSTTYSFDFVYDGSILSVAGGSDPVDGTVINVGDSFTLSISAAPGGFWTTAFDVVNGFVLAALATQESANRTGDISTTLSYQGSTVVSETETGTVESYVHIGSQLTTVDAGTLFDRFVVEYTLTAIEPVDSNEVPDPNGSLLTTISGDGLIFGGFVDPELGLGYTGAFVYSSAAVPIPASALLLIGALGGLGLAARRRRA